MLHAPAVLLDVAQVVTAHNDGPLHLGGQHHALQDAAANGHVARERALLVHVRALRVVAPGISTRP